MLRLRRSPMRAHPITHIFKPCCNDAGRVQQLQRVRDKVILAVELPGGLQCVHHFRAAPNPFPDSNSVNHLQLKGFLRKLLCSVSVVNMIMATGLAVDYSVYIVVKFSATPGASRNERVAKSMQNTGAAVVPGGITALIGTLPLAGASSTAMTS